MASDMHTSLQLSRGSKGFDRQQDEGGKRKGIAQMGKEPNEVPRFRTERHLVKERIIRERWAWPWRNRDSKTSDSQEALDSCPPVNSINERWGKVGWEQTRRAFDCGRQEQATTPQNLTANVFPHSMTSSCVISATIPDMRQNLQVQAFNSFPDYGRAHYWQYYI
ncbi:hypothetical protein FB45DRAFT_863042 [Roridomyces roridus]|uniref:Uncharacterized protein n=1 Tax=Roridomyces roridus TaxID=1738132 RepID=A0AAD7FTK7_9AGAR|nr:hypothetical protein FB45DRAFT_863042 [Roridomyces roridus]